MGTDQFCGSTDQLCKSYHLLYVMISLLKINVLIQVSKNSKNGGEKNLDRQKPFAPILKHSLTDLLYEFEGKDGYSTELKSPWLYFRDTESISCITVLPRTLLKPIFLKALFQLAPVSGLIPFLRHTTLRERTSNKVLFFSP